MVANALFLRARSARAVGDTLDAAAGLRPAAARARRRAAAGRSPARRASSTARRPRSVAAACRIGTLQADARRGARPRLAVHGARARRRSTSRRSRAWIERTLPARQRRSPPRPRWRRSTSGSSYFRQLAFILGAISLVVGFLLVTTLVTVSRERAHRRDRRAARDRRDARARRAADRARGRGAHARGRGRAASRSGSSPRATSTRILADFPGLPAAIDFFLFQPRGGVDGARAAAWSRASLAGIYPAWRAASLPIARRCARRRSDERQRERPSSAPRRPPRLRDRRRRGARACAACRSDVDAGRLRGRSSARRGAGSRTLLNLLGAIDRPTRGHRARSTAATSSAMRDREATAFRLRHVGFVFQRFYLMPTLTRARERRAADGGGGLAKRDAARARARELLDYVGLGERAGAPAAQLSGGEQQRVAIARALANRPALLLADEPTGELDARTGAEIIALFERLNADGTTIVVVTHDEELARAARRVVHMRDGVIERRPGAHDRRCSRSATCSHRPWRSALLLFGYGLGVGRDDRAALHRRGAAARRRATSGSSAAARSPCCPRGSTSR